MEYLDFLQKWLFGTELYSRYLMHMPAPFNNIFFDTAVLFVFILYGCYRIMDGLWMVRRHRAIRKRQLEIQEQLNHNPAPEPQPVTQTVQVVNCGEALAIHRLLSLYEGIKSELEAVKYEKEAETCRIRALIEEREQELSDVPDMPDYEEKVKELADLREALEESEKAKDAEVSRLTEQLEKAHADLIALRSDRDQRIAVLEEELSDARKEAKELSDKTNGYDQKIALLQNQIRELKRSAMNYESERERLEGEIAAYKERISEFESKEDTLDAAATETYADMQHALENLQMELAATKKNAVQYESEALASMAKLNAELEESVRERKALEQQAAENAETISQLSFQLFEAQRDRKATDMERKMENLEKKDTFYGKGGSDVVHMEPDGSLGSSKRSVRKQRAPVSDTPLPQIEFSGDGTTDFDRLMEQLVSSHQKETEFQEQERIRMEQAMSNVSSLDQKLVIEAKPDAFADKVEKMAEDPALDRQKEKALKQKQKEEEAKASGKKGIFGFMRRSKGEEANG